MIDNFLGIDKDIGGGGRGGWGCGVMILFFFKGQVKSPVLHNTRDGSEFYEDFGFGWGRRRERRNPRAAPYLSIMKPALKHNLLINP